jgi:D-glycero-D-manno-heptose 1,7-bisphosphate phosphatase
VSADLRAAVFLDRDGVLNDVVLRQGRPYPPDDVGKMNILPGVPGALAQLRRAGFALVVVTNQPDVARGTQSRAVVEAMHKRLEAELPLDGIYCCYHDDGDGCTCRKPAPGLLIEAAAALALDLSQSFMVGDRWRDVAAGAAAGCRTIFIDNGYEERRPGEHDARVFSLAQAKDWILAPYRLSHHRSGTV